MSACQPAAKPDPRIRIINPVDLAIYQTFEFAQDAPMVRQSMAFPDMDARAVDQALRAAITGELSQKGYRAMPDGQLSVHFTLDLKELVDIDRSYGFSARDARQEQGQLTAVLSVYFNEVATGTNVWRVEAEGPWSEEDSDLANTARLVQGALRQVPPRS